MIAIQVSLYPIGEKNIEKPLNAFWEVLEEENINYKICPLSTITWDENEERLYKTIYKAYQKARENNPAVMVTTLVTGSKNEIGKLISFLK